MTSTLRPEQPVTAEAAEASTGAIGKHLLERKVAPWWCSTVTVEYARHLGARKKDGL